MICDFCGAVALAWPDKVLGIRTHTVGEPRTHAALLRG